MVRVPLGRLESFLHEWRWDPAAEVVEDAISLFDPWGISPQELLLRLTFALQSAVGAELEGRDGFQGLSQADPGETRRLQKGFTAEDRLNIALGLTGAFYTQDALHHFSDNPDDDRSCRFCGQPDSVRHRVWYCPHFRERCGRAPSFPDVDVAIPWHQLSPYVDGPCDRAAYCSSSKLLQPSRICLLVCFVRNLWALTWISSLMAPASTRRRSAGFVGGDHCCGPR